MLAAGATGYLLARARERADCGHRPCPWCGHSVGMRLRELTATDVIITCPNCTKRVDYYPHGSSGTWHWSCHGGTSLAPPMTMGFARALNSCRPCPWIACRHHLYMEIHPATGAVKLNFPRLEPHELDESCALDVAEHGGMTLKEVGDSVNLTRERIRQLEVGAMRKLGHLRTLFNW